MSTLYRREIEIAAKAAGLDPDAQEAVVMQESSGRADAFRVEPAFYQRYLAGDPFYASFENPRRVGSSYGLMQIMYSTARQYGFRGAPEELFGIEVNLRLGAKILASLLHTNGGRLADALAAYNGGPGGVGRPVPMAYAKSVLARMDKIKAAGAFVDALSKSDVGADVPGGGAA
jgi:soluble lytic murein transglycosylase-like protein